MATKNMAEAIVHKEFTFKQGVAPPLLSVILPVYNEVATIELALDQVLAETTEKEVIVVDDGSTDGTCKKVVEWTLRNSAFSFHVFRFVSLRHPVNIGKGAAIRTGLQFARGTFVVVQDADLEVHPSSYASLIEPLTSGIAEFVIGFRTGLLTGNRLFHGAGVWTLNNAVHFLYRYRIRDAACCFKVLSRSNLQSMHLECLGFEFCPEVIAKASRMGLRIAEVEISYTPRTGAQGKKLRLLYDGMRAIKTLWHYRRWQYSKLTDLGSCVESDTEQFEKADE